MFIFLGSQFPSSFPRLILESQVQLPKLGYCSRTSSCIRLIWTPVLRGTCLFGVITFSSLNGLISDQTFLQTPMPTLLPQCPSCFRDFPYFLPGQQLIKMCFMQYPVLLWMRFSYLQTI